MLIMQTEKSSKMSMKMGLVRKYINQMTKHLMPSMNCRNVVNQLRELLLLIRLFRAQDINIVAVNKNSANKIKRLIAYYLRVSVTKICKILTPRREILAPRIFRILTIARC